MSSDTCFVIKAFQQNVLSLDIKQQRREFFEYIPSGCGCKNNETKSVHNFCYRLPSNLSVVGRPFSCKYVQHAAKLGLLDLDPSKFIEIESFSSVSSSANENNDDNVDDNMQINKKSKTISNSNSVGFPNPIFVTAASESHYPEVLVLVSTLQRNVPWQKIIFYDLGLSETQVSEIKRLCNVEYRKFPFDSYPGHVGNLFEYRWKPIIIAVSKFFLNKVV